MKIQFIVVGWHMNQDILIDGLHELKESNSSIDVFWSCHKEPTQEIKTKFEYKVFYNGGEECGAYDQAINYLDIDDKTICFFLHDDLIVKDWSFINVCVDKLLQGYKVIGNCQDYAENQWNPWRTIKIGITEQFDNGCYKDYVKEENQHLFDQVLSFKKVRPSFICMRYEDVKSIGGFEPRLQAYTSPLTDKDEWCEVDGQPHYRGTGGIGSFGNLFPALVCYKMHKIIGPSHITYLSDRYLDSDFIYECGRGEISKEHPIT